MNEIDNVDRESQQEREYESRDKEELQNAGDNDEALGPKIMRLADEMRADMNSGKMFGVPQPPTYEEKEMDEDLPNPDTHVMEVDPEYQD